MRTLIVHIDGEIEPGDIIILQCSDRYRGGCSNARAHVRETLDRIEVVNGHKQVVESRAKMTDVLDMLVQQVNNQWGDGFSAKRRNEHELVLQCMQGAHLNFGYTLAGSEKQTVTIEDLA